MLVSVLALGLWFYMREENSKVAIDSIAVLPFVNQNMDPETEYLSDGLTESIINSLAQVTSLRVIGRNSVFRYKGKETDSLIVANELGVRAVLTGRVMQRGDDLVVSAELVDVRDDKQLWGARYSRKVSDALSMQGEISREISEKLRLKLTGEEQRQLVKRGTSNGEAYQLYLKGRYYLNKRTADNVKKAIEQFRQAVDTDPNYAQAYAGLADSYLDMRGGYAGNQAGEPDSKAQAFAERALRIDESLAEAHVSLGRIRSREWDWAGAEKEYRRAIELNPNYPHAHYRFGRYLLDRGRFDDAMSELKRAQELDPLSPSIGGNLASVYRLKGDILRSIELSKQVIELDPNYPGGHEDLGWGYLKQGRFPEAIAELEKAVELSGRSSWPLSQLGHGYAVSGKRPEALGVIKELEERYARGDAMGYMLAGVYAGMGEKDMAFAWLEKDSQARGVSLQVIRHRQAFEPLWGDERYKNLLRRMGLTP